GLGGRDRLDELGVRIDTRFVPASSDGADQERASGLLHVSAKAPDERAVGRAFSSAAIELALANIPGFFATSAPGPASAYGVYWPALVPVEEVDHTVVLDDGRRLVIEPAPTGPPPAPSIEAPTVDAAPMSIAPGTVLGTHFGARSGDKGGNANVGIWARDDAGYAWLAEHLTADRLRQLLPETADRPIHRYELPNLRALNFVLVSYLGEGVASSTSFDPQAKGLGEYLRSRRT
ncbi:MAG: exopolyphosphatase, partial [Actinomycetota bacterium]|nr:exopolyphosphatase [Actinomycetota bacterium]